MSKSFRVSVVFAGLVAVVLGLSQVAFAGGFPAAVAAAR